MRVSGCILVYMFNHFGMYLVHTEISYKSINNEQMEYMIVFSFSVFISILSCGHTNIQNLSCKEDHT
jgi:succinate dehydrogenase hydrophobic anchor subunit